ncbi:phage shock protein A [Thiospirochaeta perfilievii]|uniref:Phage shock protein A n=1 Tax=Thiospirochaeta perfilievii TaxID=252967 RepID=A0A5C1QDX9_9SPIO|nr:PspA/IM30 family protein [Thiospirochaeta perfilievii]QEN05189.1 phage shock protein A [Thiospirochaeta perfilievii]
MGVFNRVKDIVTANINALLDKAEDPSKMLRLMIQEMEDTIIDLKSSCAAQLAEKKTMQRQLNEADSKTEQWSNRATLALEKGREDLAKEALIEKRNWSDKKTSLNKHFETLSVNVDLSREDIIKLEKKLISVKAKYKELSLRSMQAEESQKINQYKSFSKIEEMERQVDRMEAKFDIDSMTSSSLEDEFSKLEGNNSIDDELEILKNKLKKGE